jgi:hypothetical protein
MNFPLLGLTLNSVQAANERCALLAAEGEPPPYDFARYRVQIMSVPPKSGSKAVNSNPCFVGCPGSLV